MRTYQPLTTTMRIPGEGTPGEADQTEAGDFSVTTTTATAARVSASSRGITVNAEITPNEVLATPVTFVISASQIPATPNRSMRVPEDSFLRNQEVKPSSEPP